MKGLSFLDSYKDYQPLFLRVALIFVIFAHGRSKLDGWVERWIWLGEAMGVYGITFLPAVRWFLAAYAESIGIVFIALWLFTRYNAFLLAFTMLTALMTKVTWEPGIERLGELSSIVYIFATAFAVFLSGWGTILNLEKYLFGKEY